MKTSALKSNGTGLAYRGGMVFLRAANGALSFESAPFTAGRMTADGIRYHVTDHLGSVRAVLNGSNGEIIEAGDYAAYGDRTDRTSTVCEIWDQRPSLSTLPARDHFSGKEDQSVDFTVPYTDFGARHYAPSIRRWLTPDPLSEKYYDISPYVYCADNPVNLVDPEGMKVVPNGEEALMAIINTINEEDRDFIVVDDAGQIDRDKLNSHDSKSINYEMLKTLVNDEHMIYINVADDYQYRDNNGELHSSKLSFKGLDDYFEDPDCLKVDGTLMGDTGKTGIALLPGIGESNVNSPDNDIHVYIATGMSELSTAENYSHEANGHVLIYVLTKNRWLSGHIEGRDLEGYNKELNIILKAAILTSRKDTIKNYQGL